MTDKAKEKLVSLYSSSNPQVFTQIHGSYDEMGHKIWTSTQRVHDLRAGAFMQILFPDGVSKEIAIEYLQAAIRHLETFDMPKGPIVFPDGSTEE